jgi:putative SOS response-associated peptidase YedK
MPFHIEVGEGELFGMAGLYEQWRGAGGELLESCTILTTAANALVAPLHERMPVIVTPASYGAWLDPGCTDPRGLAALLVPRAAHDMRATAVSTRVNRVDHDDPACLDPPAPERQGSLF